MGASAAATPLDLASLDAASALSTAAWRGETERMIFLASWGTLLNRMSDMWQKWGCDIQEKSSRNKNVCVFLARGEQRRLVVRRRARALGGGRRSARLLVFSDDRFGGHLMRAELRRLQIESKF